jgi:hypothetical protein
LLEADWIQTWIYETPAEYPAINGWDECGAGVRGMQSPSLLFKMPCGLPQGALLISCMNAKGWRLRDSKALSKTVARNSSELKQKLAIYENTMKKFNEKVDSICAKPEYAAIIIKSECNVKDITFKQLADNTKITPEQKTIFLRYRTEVDAVVKEISMYMHTLTNRQDILWADYLDSTQSDVDKNNLDLLNGVITWSEYSQRRKDLYAKKLSDFRIMFHKIH